MACMSVININKNNNNKLKNIKNDNIYIMMRD